MHVNDVKKGRGRPKRTWRELIRKDMSLLSLTKETIQNRLECKRICIAHAPLLFLMEVYRVLTSCLIKKSCHVYVTGVSAIMPLTKIKVQPSELPVGCTDYKAPEHGKPRINKTSSDVNEFDVLLLELLTAKKPFDSSRVKEERPLINWLAPYLRFTKSLSEFVDPAIKDSYNSHNLSQLADVIILCIQLEPTFRPSTSDVADSLKCLLQRMSKNRQGKTNADSRLDSPDMSFLTTVTRFEYSPPMISACSEFDRGSQV